MITKQGHLISKEINILKGELDNLNPNNMLRADRNPAIFSLLRIISRIRTTSYPILMKKYADAGIRL